jgi:hypothetical protein
MKPKVSLPYSQEFATGFYLKPEESNLHPHTLFKGSTEELLGACVCHQYERLTYVAEWVKMMVRYMEMCPS